MTVTGPSTVTQTGASAIAADHLDVTVDGPLTLATQVNSLAVRATGDVDIDQTGSGTLTVTELTVADGSVAIDHPAGSIVLESVQLPTTKDANDLAVTAGANIQLGNVEASFNYETTAEAGDTVITSLGDVTLTAGGSISEHGDDVTVDLVADQLTLSAATGITGLEIAANELLSVTTTTGDISLTEYDGAGESQPGLKVTAVSADDGSVTISAAGALQAYRVVAGNSNTGLVTLESRTGNLLIGEFDGDGTTLIKPTSLSASQEALEYGYGVSLSAAEMLDTYQFFDADGHLEYRAGGAFNFDLPDSLSADTIVLDSGPALKVEGTLTAADLVELSSDTNVYIVSGTIQSSGGGNVAVVQITARGTEDSTSAVYDEGTGLQKFEQISNTSVIRLVATTDDDGNPIDESQYKYYSKESDGNLTLVSVTANEYQPKMVTISGGIVDIEETATIKASSLDIRALNKVGITKNTSFTLTGFIGGITGTDPTAEGVDLTVDGNLDLASAYITSSGTVDLNATSITADEGSTVKAGTLQVNTETGIGSSLVPLNIMADTVSLDVSADGGIYLKEADAVNLQSVVAYNGDIEVFAGGQLTATKVQTYTDGDITLQAGTDLLVDLVQTDVGVGTGTATSRATLEALGDISEVSPQDTDADVIAGTIILNDQDSSVSGLETSGSSSTGQADIDVLPEKGDDGTRVVDGDYALVAPIIPSGEDLELSITGDLNVLNLGVDPSQDVDIDFTVGGDLTLGTDLDVGDNTVTLEVDGNLTVSGKITASRLDLTATSDVVFGDLEVGSLTLNMGTATVTVVNATSLVIDSGSTAGSLVVTTTSGDVTIGDDVVVTGDVNVTANGAITITDNTLTSDNLVLVLRDRWYFRHGRRRHIGLGSGRGD